MSKAPLLKGEGLGAVRGERVLFRDISVRQARASLSFCAARMVQGKRRCFDNWQACLNRNLGQSTATDCIIGSVTPMA